MSEHTPIGIERVGQIAINARELDRATAFYRDTMGIPYLFGIPGASFFQCGPIRLMVALAEGPEQDHPASIVYYAVPDIHAAAARLGERGVKLEEEPRMVARMPDHELWMTFLRDTEGNLLALMSEVRE